MIIVFEGPDGAGKSTLIDQLSRELGLKVFRSGGPKDCELMNETITKLAVLSMDKETILCDRAPWISERIYSKALNRYPVVSRKVLENALNIPQKIVFCYSGSSEDMLPQMSLEFKAHKPKEHLEAVKNNHKRICEEYQMLMKELRKDIRVFDYDWKTYNHQQLLSWI